MSYYQQKETSVRHITDGIQMKLYGSEIGTPYHWHDEYEFLCVRSGTCICQINGVHIPVAAGEALLIRPGELHTFIDPTMTTRFFLVVFHPYAVTGTDCTGFFDRSTPFRRKFFSSHPLDREIISSLQEIHRVYLAADPLRPFLMKTELLKIFSILLKHQMVEKESAAPNLSFHKFRPLLEYVEEHYTEKILLQDMAEYLHYSPSYILFLFRQNTGQTPIAYVNRYRLFKAAQQLRETEDTVIEVALGTGFNHVGHFIRQFQKQFGLTPLQYRHQKWTSSEG